MNNARQRRHVNDAPAAIKWPLAKQFLIDCVNLSAAPLDKKSNWTRCLDSIALLTKLPQQFE